jgi:hypothetical protein
MPTGRQGIAALSTANIQGNTATGNGGVGLYLFPEAGGFASAYGGNVVSNNSVNNVTSGINVGHNSCNGTTTCP